MRSRPLPADRTRVGRAHSSASGRYRHATSCAGSSLAHLVHASWDAVLRSKLLLRGRNRRERNTIWVDVVPHPNGVDTCGGVPLPCWQAFASLDVQPCPLNTTCSGGTYSDNRYADSNGSGSNIFAVARLALDVNETYTIDGFYHIDYLASGSGVHERPTVLRPIRRVQHRWYLVALAFIHDLRLRADFRRRPDRRRRDERLARTSEHRRQRTLQRVGACRLVGVVTPTKAEFTVVPPSASYSNVWADQTQDYVGPSFSTISRACSHGNGNGGSAGWSWAGCPGPPSTDGTGYYCASVSAGWSGTVARRAATRSVLSPRPTATWSRTRVKIMSGSKCSRFPATFALQRGRRSPAWP